MGIAKGSGGEVQLPRAAESKGQQNKYLKLYPSNILYIACT